MKEETEALFRSLQMFHTEHEGLDRSELPGAADTIADRLLEALRLDYLKTLSAEGRIQQNLEEVFSYSFQPPQQMDESGDSHERKHAAAIELGSHRVMRDCGNSAAEAASAEYDGEEEEAANGEKRRDMSNGEAENNSEADSGSPAEEEDQPPFEFAYQRLSSVEELQSPQCFFDEPADGNPSCSNSAASISSPEGARGETNPLEDIAAAAEKHTPPVSPFNSDEGKKRNQAFVAAIDAEEEEEQQQQPQPIKHRHLLLGERPLEPQSAAFIAEVMRGLALKDPRELSSSNTAK
ncbi:hypothetical protein Emag_004780 [Eimeria magna]